MVSSADGNMDTLSKGIHTPLSIVNDSPSKMQRIKSVFLNTKKHSRPSSGMGPDQQTAENLFAGRLEPIISTSIEEDDRLESSTLLGSTRLDSTRNPYIVNENFGSSTMEEMTVYQSTNDSLAPDSDGFSSWTEYFLDLVRSWWNSRGAPYEPESLEACKARQLRLIMYEGLEHLDFLTDLLLVLRLFGGLFNPASRKYESIAAVLLTGILVSSTVSYLCRRSIIFHKIKGDDEWIFCPGFVFYQKVRECGYHRPGVLLMYERLQWTYTLVMRILEDVPQLLVVLCLLAQDSGILLILDASTSLMTLMASSFRMGSLYPYKSSLTLLISSSPPIDNPVVLEASPTTPKFPWLICFTMVVMGICHFICAQIMRQRRLQSLLYSCFSLGSFTVAFTAASYASYLSRQYQAYKPMQSGQRTDGADNGIPAS